MSIARMNEIRSSMDQALSLTRRGRQSFQDMLEAEATSGGPRLDIPNDPTADLVLSGGSTDTSKFVSLPLTENRSGPVTPGGTTTDIASPSLPLSLPTISNLPASFEPGSVNIPVTGSEWMTALPEKGQPWAQDIAAAARQHNLDPRLMAALVWSESGFNASVTSPAGAIGLAQLMPGTAEGLGVDPWNPQENLEGGARYLKTQLDRFGTPELALAAYNAGPGRVERSGGIPQIAETQAYVSVVMQRYAQLGGTR